MKSKAALAAATEEASPVTLVWGMTRREAAILAAIVLATIAIYLPSLRNGWVADDWELIADNKLIHNWSFVWNSFRYDVWWFRDPSSLPQSLYYRPLEDTWFAANALLFGVHPAALHLAEIVVHTVAVVLCFRVAQLISGDVATGLLTAAIFAVMPANLEAVIWAGAIPELLSTVFELGAMLFLIGRKPGWSSGLLISAILYGCATLTHESAILFPLIVFAYVLLFERGDETETRLRIAPALSVCAPFLVVVIAYMCARLNALGPNFLFGPHYSANYNTGSMVAHGFVTVKLRYSPAQILMTLPVVLSTYLAVLVLPTMAAPAHAVYWSVRPQPLVFVCAAALVLIAAVVFAFTRRSSNRRIYLFCALWGLITIAPAMNLNALYTLVEDRYLYAPSFGWSLAFAVAAFQVAAAGTTIRKAVGAAMALLLVLYAASTMRTQRYWHDDVTYLQRCIEIAPLHLDYRASLVKVMNKSGDFEGAVGVLQRETALDPDDAHVHLLLAEQYHTMGRELDSEREFVKFNELSNAMIRRQRAARSSGASEPAAAPADAPASSGSP